MQNLWLLSRAKVLRKTMTDAEKRLWFFLRSHRFNQWKFKRQVPIAGYIADFVCFRRKLIIEVDGGQHDENQLYDQERTYLLQQEGFRVIRFWNHDVLQNMTLVLEKIDKELMEAPSPALSGTLSHEVERDPFCIKV